jgi:hypothetical protein
LKEASDYRGHAEECRLMASRTTDPHHRAMLTKMAETWDGLAVAREIHVARRERIAALTGNEESNEWPSGCNFLIAAASAVHRCVKNALPTLHSDLQQEVHHPWRQAWLGFVSCRKTRLRSMTRFRQFVSALH